MPKSQNVHDGELAVLTVAQAEAAASELANFKPYDVLMRSMAHTGLRAGEVTGLRVRDMDLTAGRVSVRQTAQ